MERFLGNLYVTLSRVKVNAGSAKDGGDGDPLGEDIEYECPAMLKDILVTKEVLTALGDASVTFYLLLSFRRFKKKKVSS
jgi:hypothetical protein